jgi:hypothetical protein
LEEGDSVIAGIMGDDDDKSVLFSHDQRLAQGEENYESYVICYFKPFLPSSSNEVLAMA